MSTKRCRHKRLIMATADYVDFQPDQEPFTSGVIECAGVSNIKVPHLAICYCPKCKVVVFVGAEGECSTILCLTGNRCDGHE